MVNKKFLNYLGTEAERTYNTGNLIKNAKFHDLKYLGEGESRITFTDETETSVIKIAQNTRGVTHNKLEKFMLNELQDSRIRRHLPKFYNRSANYWVLNIEYIDGEQVPWDIFWNDKDIEGFKQLSLDQDLEDNILWSSKRNTWVLVDLGMCWRDEDLALIINKLRNNQSIEDYYLS